MEAISVAVEAAQRAGELIVQQFHQPQKVRLKGPADLVTQVDRDAEDLIVRTIHEAFPDHEFLGEEGHAACRDAQHLWVIDPLDGTRNYALGVPFFCTSIALVVRGRTALGVVHDPLHGETFTAEAGQGAYLNGRRMRPSRRASMQQAVVAVGFVPVRNVHDTGLAVPVLARLRPKIEATRTMGAVALSLAYVACGRFDIAYQDWLSSWDMLAGALLVEEAGGAVTDFNGEPITTSSHDIVAANVPAFHARVLETVRQVLSDRDTHTESARGA